jgi:hypothetical protein
MSIFKSALFRSVFSFIKTGKESGYEFIKNKVDNIMKYQHIKALELLLPAEEVYPN